MLAPSPATAAAPRSSHDLARSRAATAFRVLERAFDRVFGLHANPWRHLGALAYALFWIVVATGAWIYVPFDTSVAGAYASVARLADDAFPLGSISRSIHRYASDAFVGVVLLHLAREWALRRYAHFRRFSWLTGVATLWLVYASGIGGFWLVWDGLAQYSLVATAEWLDVLPMVDGLARNFDAGMKVSDRLFSLLMFLHIGLPLALLALMWVHVSRLARADTVPVGRLALGTTAALIALALVAPVETGRPADLAAVPADLRLDWFYLGGHAFADAAGVHALWAVAIGATAWLALLPFVSRGARAPRPIAARVDVAQCNGCARCFADCPYLAITMAPRTDGGRHARQAAVTPALCAGCGICAGACPSSTPFRSAFDPATGIDMPQLPMRALRAALDAALARIACATPNTRPRIVVFACSSGELRTAPAHDDAATVAIALLCAAQLPPAFVEYALRAGADGVLVSGCSGDCAFRLGMRWTRERFATTREPHLRASAPRPRVRVVQAGGDADAIAREVRALRAAIAVEPPRAPPPKRISREIPPCLTCTPPFR